MGWEYEYHEDGDYFTYPDGVILEYKTTNRNGYREYRSEQKACKNYPFKNQCTMSKNKTLTRHIHQKHANLVESKRLSTSNKNLYGMRKEKIERVFADVKYKHRLGLTNLRGIERNQNQVHLIFACHNMKKMALWESNAKFPIKNGKDKGDSRSIFSTLFQKIRKILLKSKKRAKYKIALF